MITPLNPPLKLRGGESPEGARGSYDDSGEFLSSVAELVDASSDPTPSKRSFLLTGGAVFRPMVAGTLAPSMMLSRSAATFVLR